jgi:hypothetical protein
MIKEKICSLLLSLSPKAIVQLIHIIFCLSCWRAYNNDQIIKHQNYSDETYL